MKALLRENGGRAFLYRTLVMNSGLKSYFILVSTIRSRKREYYAEYGKRELFSWGVYYVLK